LNKPGDFWHEKCSSFFMMPQHEVWSYTCVSSQISVDSWTTDFEILNE